MKQIIVVKLGWVLFGRVSEHEHTLDVKNAHVIRVWGTNKGLGEIALSGPTKSTVLDPCGHIVIERHAVLFRIDCEPASWTKY
jgi:hypothetical protein